ncbi:MAG: PhoH family protein [Spirochaetaceae bacterium]|nr:PhoH family protein [Spirochaetaceae bacterium]
MESIVLDDTELLAELCGANDYNLAVISDLLGAKVHCIGNELSISTESGEKQELFLSLVQAMTRSMEGGLPATPDLIIALHAELTPLGLPSAGRGTGNGEFELTCDDFLETCVQIPGGYAKIYPRSKGQSLYLKGLATHDLVISVGPAGTGKTFLAMSWALKELMGKSRRKLVLTRPIVEAGENLGFLPGDLVQKINPYLRPLYDAMELLLPFDTISRLEESRAIEVAPLAYMRGRNLSNCIVILDEAQNTTKEQMKMFLTRLGENTKAIVTGDITQIDLPRKSESGLIHAIQILSGIDDIFISHLDARDVVRSPLVKKIIEAYENE